MPRLVPVSLFFLLLAELVIELNYFSSTVSALMLLCSSLMVTNTLKLYS